MKTQIMVPAVLLLSMMLIVPASYADKGKGDCPKGKGMGMHDGMGMHGGKGMRDKKLDEKFFHKAHLILMNQEELKLTDKQAKEIKDLKIATKKELIKKQAEIDLIAVDIKANLHEDKIDVKATNNLVDKKYDLKKAKTKTLVKAFADLKGQLNDDQLKALKGLYGKGMCDKDKKK